MKLPRKFVSQASADWRWIASLLLIFGSTVGLELRSQGTPPARSEQLSSFPAVVGPWNGTDIPIEERVQAVLGASDFLNRVYLDRAAGDYTGIFVAYYDSQRKGGAIHSPRNCLPGAGWSIVKGDVVPVLLPGRSEPARVNRVLVQNGVAKQVILYWYQSQGRIVASEYTAKICLLWDAATKNRTDGAIVRISVPVRNGDEDAALGRAQDFLHQAYPDLRELIPS